MSHKKRERELSPLFKLEKNGLIEEIETPLKRNKRTSAFETIMKTSQKDNIERSILRRTNWSSEKSNESEGLLKWFNRSNSERSSLEIEVDVDDIETEVSDENDVFPSKQIELIKVEEPKPNDTKEPKEPKPNDTKGPKPNEPKPIDLESKMIDLVSSSSSVF